MASILPDQWSIPYVALLAYTFAIVTQRFPIGTPAIVLGIFSLVFLKQRLRSAPPVNFLAMLTVWSSICYFASDYQSVVADSLFTFLKLVLIAFLTVNAIRTRKQALFFLIFAVVWHMYYPVRVTLLNYFVWGYTTYGRAVGPGFYSNPNDLAALTLLSMSAVFAISVGLRQKWARWTAIFLGSIMAIVIILTQSRGAFLGAIVILALVIGAAQRKARLILGLLVALILLTMLLPESTFDRFERLASTVVGESSIADADEEGSAAERSQIARIALRISMANPVTGVGLGTYPYAMADYYELNSGVEIGSGGHKDAHSTYLTMLAETGIPGLVLFLLIFAKTFRPILKFRRSLLINSPIEAMQLGLLVAGYIGFLVAALVGTYTNFAIMYVHMCAIWAYSESLKNSANEIR